MRRFPMWSAAAAAGLAVPLALAAVPAQAATAARPYDVDGDGRPELVVGAPGLQVGAHAGAGGVVVLRRTDDPGAYRRTVLTQSSAKVVGASEDGDHFGAALASADFDRDGYADLAVGQPGESVGTTDGSGAVTILYGGRKGLTGKRSVKLELPGKPYEYAGFGTALAVGDLNGDGYADLAVGAPGDRADDRSSLDNPASGTVTVFFGSRKGLRATGSRQVHGVRGTDSQQDTLFGNAVAVADVDGDGHDDLVVTAQGHQDDDDGSAFPGSVSACPGTSAGPTGCRRLDRGRDLQETATVVVGNVQGDARPEVVVGVPSSSILNDPGHLEVLALVGTGAATSVRATRLGQSDLGVPGASGEEEGVDDFGQAVAVGRVDADGYDDLVVGAPSEKVGDERAGRVVVVHGGAQGLARSGNVAYDQDTRGVPGGSEAGDAFGASLALLDRDGDGRADLVIGAPGEDDDGGRVTVLRGTGTGFTTTGADTDSLADHSYPGRGQARFGEALGR